MKCARCTQPARHDYVTCERCTVLMAEYRLKSQRRKGVRERLKRGPEIVKSKTYRTWLDIKTRCRNPKHKTFEYYGGRGVVVCERWLKSFDDFLADMGEAPSKEHQIDRIDVDGDYAPENCRWATRIQQARNKRNNRRITFRGETMCATEWAERLGLTRDGLRNRLAKWPLEAALTMPAVKGRPKILNELNPANAKPGAPYRTQYESEQPKKKGKGK